MPAEIGTSVGRVLVVRPQAAGSAALDICVTAFFVALNPLKIKVPDLSLA